MAKNPILQKKFEEGYMAGRKDGKKEGNDIAVKYIIDSLNDFEEMPGIGAKTIEKLKLSLELRGRDKK